MRWLNRLSEAQFDPERRKLLKLLGLGTVGLSCAPLLKSSNNQNDNTAPNTYDYIVVGSGAGGGPLACNLALAGYSVLLIEAGSDQGNNLNYQIPIFHPKASQDPAMRWDYVVQHYSDPARQQLDPKSITDPSGQPGVLYPRAAALGGCTAHNAMITVYPHESDWDNLAAITGDSSWASQNMRQYFSRIEDCRYEPTGTAGHGFGGWLTTERASPTLALTDLKVHQMVISAAKAFSAATGQGLGTSIDELVGLLQGDINTADPSRDTTEGLFSVPLATRNGVRIGPRDYIVQTVNAGAPLTVATNALATKITFNDQRGSGGTLQATGVQYLPGAHLFKADPNSSGVDPTTVTPVQATANREVIVSAGSYNTPQLLMLSGIGPSGSLLNLPGVGQNMQDRYEVGVVCSAPSDFSTVEACTYTADQNDPCFAKWQNGSGPYTSNGALLGIVKRSDPSQPVPDLFIFGLPTNFRGYFPGYDQLAFADKQHFTWAVLKAHTGNTAGVVSLRSQNAWDTPLINFNYFDTGTTSQGQDAADLQAVVSGMDLARQIYAQANSLASELLIYSQFTEETPGPSVAQGDEGSYIKNNAWGHHACGTCKIGADSDPMAVLDANFNVRGTSGLRVVDASVFPSIPGFFIVTPIYMISEKASDVILAAAQAANNVAACTPDGQAAQNQSGSDCCSKNGIDANGNCAPPAAAGCTADGAQPQNPSGADCCSANGLDANGNCAPPAQAACTADGQPALNPDGSDCCSMNGFDSTGNCLPGGSDGG